MDDDHVDLNLEDSLMDDTHGKLKKLGQIDRMLRDMAEREEKACVKIEEDMDNIVANEGLNEFKETRGQIETNHEFNESREDCERAIAIFKVAILDNRKADLFKQMRANKVQPRDGLYAAWSILRDKVESFETTVSSFSSILQSKIPKDIIRHKKKGGRKVPEDEYQKFNPISLEYMEILKDVEDRKVEKDENKK